MADGSEALLDVASGGAIARAVEPATGERAGEGHGACLNCGTALLDGYCHRCGQAAHVHRTMRAFVHELAHGVLHLDGKVWRTLPMLIFRPGELTRRYVEGERARFVSPMALFLFSVFLMFAVIQLIGGPFDTDHVEASDRVEIQREFQLKHAEASRELEQLRARRQQLMASGGATVDIDRDIAIAERAWRVQDALYKRATGAVSGEKGARIGGLNIDSGIPALDKGLEKAASNPDLVLYKLQSNAYKYSWALIPISAPFLWLLFLHRRRHRQHGAYDHVVFVTYSIAFMTLGFVVLTLLRPLAASEAIAGLAIMFVPPIHMYKQLRGAYRLSRTSALWRTVALLLFAVLAAGLFFSFVLALGL